MEVGYVVFNLKPGAKRDFLLQARKIKAVKDVRIVLGTGMLLPWFKRKTLKKWRKRISTKLTRYLT